MPTWSLTAALAGLPIALIAIGPAMLFDIDSRTLPIYASQIAVAVLVMHIGFSVLANHRYGDSPGTMRWLLVAVALLALPLIWSNDQGAGVLAYFNFASGTVGGIAIAVVWISMPRGFSWIDVGYAVFLVGGVAQLLGSYSRTDALNSLHQASDTPWANNSNFVAGGLVVAALIVMARSRRVGRHRKYAITLGLAAITVALLTLSRGAMIGACVGAMFFLWSRAGRQLPQGHRPGPVKRGGLGRGLLRLLAVFVPLAGFLAVDRATEIRAQLDSQVYSNIDMRLEMYRLAWDEFLKSPLTGTGWASFRDVSLGTAGQSQTFAHNLVVSMLQIGGLLSIPYLVVLAVLSYRALRRGGPYTAAVAAALAISMTQPFFESTVCNLIVLPIAFLAATKQTTDSDHEVGSTPANATRAHRPRVHASNLSTVH